MNSEKSRHIENFKEFGKAWDVSETVEARIGLLHCGLTSKTYGNTPEMICFYLDVAVTCKGIKDWRSFDYSTLCAKALHMLMDYFFKDGLWKKHVIEEDVLDRIIKLLQPDTDKRWPYVRLTDTLKTRRMEIFKTFLEDLYKSSLEKYADLEQNEWYTEVHPKLATYEKRLAELYPELTDIMNEMRLLNSVVDAHRGLQVIPHEKLLQKLQEMVFSNSNARYSCIRIPVGEYRSRYTDREHIFFNDNPKTIEEAILRNSRIAKILMELTAVKEGLEQLHKRAEIELKQKELDQLKNLSEV